MDQISVIQIIITVIGSSAVFSFVQFLITRKDNKRKDNIDTKINQLKDELEDDVNDKVEIGVASYQKQMKIIDSIQTSMDKLATNDEEIKETIEKVSELQDTMADSLKGQTHDRILWLSKDIANRGGITIKEKANIESMYRPYVAFGGNGEVKKSVEYIMDLPVISEEESRKREKELEKAHLSELFNEIDMERQKNNNNK